MTTSYYGFDVTLRDAYGVTSDRVWVGATNQKTARLTALATWPQIETITFHKAIEDTDD